MKRIFCLKVLFLIVSFISVARLQAQRFDSVLLKLDSEFPQEKIYIHFDRSVYNPGETIWMKAYVITGNSLSNISTTVYFDLFDDQGKILEQKTAPVAMSGAAAAFDLPASLKSQTVHIRAYTNWMMNFDSSYIFTKTFPIINAAAKPEAPITNTPLIYFFPEGGDLINGLPSKVAFKASDRSGIPIKVTGEIKNQKGEKVADFASVHDGMGTFTLVPEAGAKYTASWKDEKGKTFQSAIPAAKNSGITLAVVKAEGGFRFTVTRPENAVGSPSSVYVVAQMHQQLLYRARGSLEKSSNISSLIPTATLPAGIAQITVFTEDHKPIAERIVFVNSDDYYFITDLNAPLKSTQERGRNVLQVDVPDTLECNLSISVTDADLNPLTKGEEDIFSKILLTSDIKGYIHNPSYYFSDNSTNAQEHLDLVMMTNGWRRFRWEDVLAGKFPQIKYMPDQYLSITGDISGINKNILSKQEVTAILKLKSGEQQLLSVPVADGKFQIGGLIFYDTAQIYYQFNNDKNRVLSSSAIFSMKNNLMNAPQTIQGDSLSLARLIRPDSSVLKKNNQVAAINQQQDEARRKVQTLESVVVTGRQKSKEDLMDEKYTSGLFSGGDGYTFITEDDPIANGAMTVLQYLQGRVAGLQISANSANATLSWRGGTPDLFLNEMRGDVSLIQSLPMTDVAMIKVFRPPFFGGFGGGAGGAIAVYTKKGEARSADFKGLDNAKIAGYTPVKEFFAPDYSKATNDDGEQDYRKTLYWNPFLITTKEKRRTILTFYNNDITKRFRVVIEGVNQHGKLTRIEKIFEQ